VEGYSPDQCPQTLDFLGGAILLHIDQSSPRRRDVVVEGIRKVAVAIL
jgi:hypothetical protein